MEIMLNRQDAKAAKKGYLYSKIKLGVLGVLAVNFFLLKISGDIQGV
jgi:hypothetical protein